jgi:hypothetical protein
MELILSLRFVTNASFVLFFQESGMKMSQIKIDNNYNRVPEGSP